MSPDCPGFYTVSELIVHDESRIGNTGNRLINASDPETDIGGWYWHLHSMRMCYGPFRTVNDALASYHEL